MLTGFVEKLDPASKASASGNVAPYDGHGLDMSVEGFRGLLPIGFNGCADVAKQRWLATSTFYQIKSRSCAWREFKGKANAGVALARRCWAIAQAQGSPPPPDGFSASWN